MWGCCSEAASWISRRNRSAFTPPPSLGARLSTTTPPPQLTLLRQEHATHPAAAEFCSRAVGSAESTL